MINRQRFLLGVVDFLQKHGRSTKLDIIKVMFVIAKERPPGFSMYGFYPYKIGPFSSQIYSDLSFFAAKGIVEEIDKAFTVTHEGMKEELLPSGYADYLAQLLARYPTVETLIDYVYTNYPEYAMKSERKNVPVKVQLETTPCFFLIGYEGRTIDDFLNELIVNNIQILVDVRNNPRSMKYEFNKERLKKALSQVSIEYINIPELGVQHEKRKHLETKDDYERLFASYAAELPRKERWLKYLCTIGENKRVAIMCFEKDYQSCHRREIGKNLRQYGQDIRIIS
ncbi:MAG: DUF488 family protein [Candidatus Sigynarchaeota archaeon]